MIAGLVLFSPDLIGDVSVATLVAAPVATVILAVAAGLLINKTRKS